ncbi:MAG: SAM-dependent methyltransferase [Prevotellaceae bacterium]|jgi:precorrin-6B methylase 2|nr:SAM-dependent methyltransferase [Prevotellaceae bacterium]
MIDAATITFIQTHIHDNPQVLLLSAQQYKGVDVRFAAQQIEARQQNKDKLPQWVARPELIFPSSIACQQASSEETAIYKQRFVKEGDRVIDCTGGMGIDSIAFAYKAAKVIYIEQNESLCKAARHNFGTLGTSNIEVQHGSCIDFLPTLPNADIIYIDPSRRNINQKRFYAIDDYEPKILSIKEALLQKANKVLVKISPMADIRQTLHLLPEATEVHVVSVMNECKELLFLLEKRDGQPLSAKDVPIVCVDVERNGEAKPFAFTLYQESITQAIISDNVPEGFLYEPNVSLLKGGAFKLISTHFGLQKLYQNTHLYSSPTPLYSFPGRIFKIKSVLSFNKQTIKNLHKTIPMANVAIRNFCMEAPELRKRLKIKEGGDIYLFGVMLYDKSYALVVAEKI